MSARGPGVYAEEWAPRGSRDRSWGVSRPGLPQGQPQRAGAADESPECPRRNPPARAGVGKGPGKLVGLRAVELAVALLMWAVGSAFGALGLSSFEGGECERGERYLLYMAYFWLVALAAMVSSSVLSGRAVLVLACLAAIFFVGVVVVPGRLLGRSMREEDLGTTQRRLWRR